MSGPHNLNWLRSLYPTKSPNICTGNSVLPINPDTQPEVKESDVPDTIVEIPEDQESESSSTKQRDAQKRTELQSEDSQESLEDLPEIRGTRIGSHGDGESGSATHEPVQVRTLEPEESIESFELPEIPDTVIRVPEESGSSSLRRRNSKKDPFIVSNRTPDIVNTNEVPETSCQTKPSQCLQLYYDMMYYTGFCTYRARLESGEKPVWWILVGIVQKTCFWSLAILSVFQSVCLTKTALLEIMDGKEYSSFVSFAYSLVLSLAKIYAINLFAFKKEKTDKMLHEMDEYETSHYAGTNEKHRCSRMSWKKMLLVLLIVITITSGITRAIVGNPDEDSKGIILDSSHEFSIDLFVWESNLTSQTNILSQQYGKTLTSTTITFGIIVITRDAASYMVLGIIFDLVLIVAGVIYIYVKEFIKEVKAVTANVPKENVMEWTQLQAKREAVWKKYRKQRAVVSAVNNVFDPLLKLMHGGNLLMFVFFMVICVLVKSTWIYRLLYSLCMVKVEISYYVAGWIAEANDIVRAWLRNWALYTGKIKVGEEELDANMVLDELDKEPIGLGKGKFLIHHTFHFKFLGLVGSAFLSMADEEKNA